MPLRDTPWKKGWGINCHFFGRFGTARWQAEFFFPFTRTQLDRTLATSCLKAHSKQGIKKEHEASAAPLILRRHSADSSFGDCLLTQIAAEPVTWKKLLAFRHVGKMMTALHRFTTQITRSIEWFKRDLVCWCQTGWSEDFTLLIYWDLLQKQTNNNKKDLWGHNVSVLFSQWISWIVFSIWQRKSCDHLMFFNT